MKQIETIKTGNNYAAVNVGKMNEIIEHELPMGPDVTIKGKVFVGQAVGATGSELSFQTLVPGQDSGFLHTHKTHEESSSRAKVSIRWTAKCFPSARVRSSVCRPKASVR